MKIKTEKLQVLLEKVNKGAGNNKLLPITMLMCLENENKLLKITTTDGVNYVRVTEHDCDIEDDFYAVVDVEKFVGLISRLTCDIVELNVGKSALEIIGNGTYSIPLQFDESGEILKYPNPEKDLLWKKVTEINTGVVDNILKTCKQALAVNVADFNTYTNYYVSDCVIATNISKICDLEEPIFETPKLISSRMMDLLGMLTDKIVVYESDDYTAFTSDNVFIYGKNVVDDSYQIAAINGLINQEFTSVCEIFTYSLYDALDRVGLFIELYDNGAIKLIFDKDGLTIQSTNSSAVERLSYISNNFTEHFGCMVQVQSLLDMIKCVSEEKVTIEYGQPNAIKLKHGKVIQILALIQE